MSTLEQLGRYLLIERVGRGGMAEVYLAHQRGPDGFVKPCVLKRIAPAHGQSPTVRRMFLEEARVSALLSHRNVVQTFDYGEEDGVPFMAMELVDGLNLAQMLHVLAKSQRWLSIRPALEICLQVLDALEYAHNLKDLNGAPLNLVHRDVSPQNILLSRQGDVKLADFGIARHDARMEKTRIHAPKGKPGYMAVEQALGGEIDGRADVFSLGVVLIELMGARRVHKDASTLVAISKLPERLERICRLREDAPEPLIQTILSLTAIEPEDRPPTAAEAHRALTKHLSEVPGGTPLRTFLRRIFAEFVVTPQIAAKPESAPSASIDGLKLGTPSDPQVEVGAPTIADVLPASVDFDDLSFEATWANRKPSGKAHTDDLAADEDDEDEMAQGWPTVFRKESVPKLQLQEKEPTPIDDAPVVASPAGGYELMGRSSDVNAMKHFAPSFSDEAKKRSDPNAQPDEAATAFQDRLPSLPKPGSAPPGDSGPGDTLKKWLPIALGFVIITLIAAGILSLASRTNDAPDETAWGRIIVTSNPPGAAIILDGRAVAGAKTPHTLDTISLQKPVSVAVRLANHKAIPARLEVSLSADHRETQARFVLKRGRTYTIETAPDGAAVTLDGARLRGVTPMAVGPIPLGETATLTLTLPEHIPEKYVLSSAAETATIARIELTAGRDIDVLSEPPGAKVSVDGQPRGKTPLYDLTVPANAKFKVRFKRSGYYSVERTVRVARLKSREYVVRLKPRPLLKLPMSASDRRKAKELVGSRGKLRRRIKKLTGAKKKLAARLEKLQSARVMFVGEVASVQSRLDAVDLELSQATADLEDVENNIEALRAEMLTKHE